MVRKRPKSLFYDFWVELQFLEILKIVVREFIKTKFNTFLKSFIGLCDDFKS